ncbi:MAG TPA: phage/plasmid primase, P4 family [Thermodesulfobacteriota bacterium]
MKVGADDFLAARGDLGPAAWRKLEQKAITLAHPVFARFRRREASERAAIPERDGLTDTGNAERLVAADGEDLRYCEQAGRWFVYDHAAGVWIRDEAGEVMRRAKMIPRAMYQEAAGLADDKARAALVAHARKSESEPALRRMVKLAESEPGIPIRLDAFDADPWVFNVANGTLDLREGTFGPHRRERLLTKRAPVAYDPDAECPTFRAFLARIFAGDQDVIGFVQRAVGYSLTGDTSEQILLFLWGLGANGKTTLLELLRALLGDYAEVADFSTFLASDRDGPRNDLAKLRAARLVTAVEVGEGRRLAEALVKQVTGGDMLTARFLFHEFFTFRPAFKLWLAANHKPAIKGTDHAIWRRIRLIPFTVTIPPEEQDRDLPAKLRAELSGVLNWALEGCRAWQRDGLGQAEAVRQATAAYQAEQDPVGPFLDEACVLEPSAYVPSNALRNAYERWCEANGEKPVSPRAFADRLKERGLVADKGTGGRRQWLGIRLVEGSER